MPGLLRQAAQAMAIAQADDVDFLSVLDKELSDFRTRVRSAYQSELSKWNEHSCEAFHAVKDSMEANKPGRLPPLSARSPARLDEELSRKVPSVSPKDILAPSPNAMIVSRPEGDQVVNGTVSPEPDDVAFESKDNSKEFTRKISSGSLLSFFGGPDAPPDYLSQLEKEAHGGSPRAPAAVDSSSAQKRQSQSHSEEPPNFESGTVVSDLPKHHDRTASKTSESRVKRLFSQSSMTVHKGSISSRFSRNPRGNASTALGLGLTTQVGNSGDLDLRAALGEISSDNVQIGDAMLDDTWMRRFVALPGSRLRICWDVTGVMFVGYDGFMIPFMQAFYRDSLDPTISALMLISTIFWTLDIPMSFLVGYHAGGLIEMRMSRIAKRYARTWLVPDVIIACLDWLFIALGLIGDQDSAGSKTDNNVALARVARTVRVFRMLRIVRLLRLPKLFRKVRELYTRIRSEVLKVCFQMWGILGVMIILTHFVACGWYAVGRCEWGEIVFCTVGEQSWPLTAFGPESESTPLEYKYSTALHWAASQFAVAGTEIAPASTRERFYAVCVTWFGLMAFSVFVSSITTNMTQLRQINSATFSEEEALKNYMSDHKVSLELGRCIMDYLAKYRRTERLRVHEAEIEVLKYIPDRLRIQLRIEVFMPCIKVHPFFRTLCEVDVIKVSKLCHKGMTELRLRESQELFQYAEKAQGIYFVVHGAMLYHVGQDHEFAPLRVQPSAWTSEAALWFEGWSHRGRLSAVVASEVIRVSVDLFARFIKGQVSDGASPSAFDDLLAARFTSTYALGFCAMQDGDFDETDPDLSRTDLWGTTREISDLASNCFQAAIDATTSLQNAQPRNRGDKRSSLGPLADVWANGARRKSALQPPTTARDDAVVWHAVNEKKHADCVSDQLHSSVI